MIQSNIKPIDRYAVLKFATSAAIQTLIWVSKLLLLLFATVVFSAGVTLLLTYSVGGLILAGVLILILWPAVGRSPSPPTYHPPN